jgi:gliding motility-associated-like protein
LNGTAITGATNATYSATASGIYTVTATALGCTSAASAGTTVTVNPTPATPTITAGGTTTFCQGGSVVLTSSAATGNVWYLNGTAITGATNATYSATASGIYTVTATVLSCTSAASAGTTVTVNPIPATPTITAGGTTTFCQGGSVVLTSSSTTGNVWYLNGTAITGATNATYSATASGIYTVTASALGCTSAASAGTTVTVNPIPATPTITAGGTTTFCQGGSVVLTSSSTTGNVWYLNGTAITGATNATYSATSSGIYTVTATALGCTSAASAGTTVTVNPIPATPTITAGGTTTFCQGGSVILTSSSTIGNVWYLNGTAITGATNATYSATASGIYTVTASALGCTSAASAGTTVTVNPTPATPTAILNQTFCASLNPTVGSLLTNSGVNIKWYSALTGGSLLTSNTALTNGSHYYCSQTIGTCESARLDVTVTIIPTIALSVTGACNGAPFVLNVSPIGGGSFPVGSRISWSGPNFYSSNLQNPIATEIGTYNVKITDAGGCESTGSILVDSISCLIQSGLSPNGQNPSFDLSAFKVKTLNIYNRYGRREYTKQYYSNEWFGQSENGNDLPDGTYYYEIERLNGENLTGWIYINREHN